MLVEKRVDWHSNVRNWPLRTPHLSWYEPKIFALGSCARFASFFPLVPKRSAVSHSPMLAAPPPKRFVRKTKDRGSDGNSTNSPDVSSPVEVALNPAKYECREIYNRQIAKIIQDEHATSGKRFDLFCIFGQVLKHLFLRCRRFRGRQIVSTGNHGSLLT
jgi:hypothetical protein